MGNLNVFGNTCGDILLKPAKANLHLVLDEKSRNDQSFWFHVLGTMNDCTKFYGK